MNKILLVDGHSIAYRAFYGQARSGQLTAPDGTPTGAVYTFINMLLRFIDQVEPTHIAVLFDTSDPTFRTGAYAAYKANRSQMPDDLIVQMPLITKILEAMNIKVISKSGYEADDLIGTLSLRFADENNHVYILSGDRDDLQLLSDNISQIYPGQRGKTTIYTPEKVKEDYGIEVSQIVDMKALMGDSSDNIPGVKGIGEKTAIKLLQEYPSLDEIYINLESIKGSNQKKLDSGKEVAYLSYDLAKIDRDVEIDCDLDHIIKQNPNKEELSDIFIKLGFSSLVSKFNLKDIVQSKIDLTRQDVRVFELSQDQLLEQFKNKDFAILNLVKNKNSETYTVSLNNSVDSVFVASLLKDEVRDLILSFANHDTLLVTYDWKKIFKEFNVFLSNKIVDLSILAYLLNYEVDGKSESEIFSTVMNREILLGNVVESKLDKLKLDKSTLDIVSLASESLELYENLNKDCNEKNLIELAEKIEFPLISVLARMEVLGVKVEADILRKLGDEFEKTAEELAEKIYAEANYKFNINSSKQLAEVLYEKMGIVSSKKTPSGAYSTAADVLEDLAVANPIVSDVLNYRKVTKLQSTFTDGLLKEIAEDGRIHSIFHQKLTTTGRLSSSNPNLQNIPTRDEEGRKIRKAFVPKPGYKFIDADYSQIELRLLAELSGDETLLNYFKNDKDIHTETAANIFNIPAEQVTHLQRSMAKTVNFSIIYGISAFSLSKDLKISVKAANEYIDAYYELFSEVKPYMQSLIDFAYENGYVETYFSRRRYIPELKEKNFNKRKFGERAAMNAPIQGTAADIMKLAMINLSSAIEEADLDAEILIQVHDEVLIEVKEEDVESCQKLVKEVLESVVDFKVPLKADVQIGENWYESKD